MKNNWKKILNELSYRVSSGIPDLTNEQHLMKLWDILKEHKWPVDARVELLKNLDEAKRVKRYPGTTWVTASGHAGKRADGKSQYGLKSKEVAQAYVSGKDVDKDTDPKTIKPSDIEEPTDTSTDTEEPQSDEKDFSYEEKSTSSKNVEKSIGIKDNDEFSDNNVKRQALEYGFKGEDKDGNKVFKAAPGSEGSMLNEIISGEAVSLIENNPELSDEEIVAKLKEMYGDSKLFKNRKKKIDKDLLAATRSGRQKQRRVNEGVDKLAEEGKMGKDVKVRNYYGHEESKAAMKKLIDKSDGPFYIRTGVEVPKNVLLDLIKNSGGGDNPSDTATIAMDGEGKAVVMFTSDKMTTGDIQANSTPSKEYDTKVERVQNSDLPEETKKKVVSQLRKTKGLLQDKERELSGVVVEPARQMSEKVDDEFIQDIKNDAKIPLVKTGTTKGQPTVKVSSKLESVTKVTSGKKKTYLNEKYLPEGVEAKDATEVQKVKAFYDWVADPERLKENERLIAAGEEPNEPTGNQMQFLQRTGIQNDIALAEGISKIRQESVDIQQNAFDELDKEKTKDGEPLGTHLERKNIEKQLHLNVLDEGEGEGVAKYDGLFEVNMGGTVVDRKVLEHCLGAKSTKQFKENFSVGKPGKGQRFQYSDKKAGFISGRVILIYNQEGKPFAEKVQRPKAGQLAKLNTTYKYNENTQKCFKSGKKP